MTNPTDKQLLQAIYSETHQAAEKVSRAWNDFGAPTVAQGADILAHLSAATSAMTALNERLRGVPPPKIGP